MGGNLASYWGVNISSSLYGLDTTDTVSLNEAGTNLSNIKMNDVTKLALGIFSNANLGLL